MPASRVPTHRAPVLIAGMLLGMTSLVAQAAAPVTAAELDSIVQAQIAGTQMVGLSVGVMQNGRVVLAKGYGVASLATGTPVTPTTMFPIGSVTKQFNCSAALLLDQDGTLSMSDPVSKYFPTLTRADEITLLDLGQHVSGYRDYYPLDYVHYDMERDVTADTIIARFATLPLDFDPGTQWSYSNTNFTILGAVAERVSGKSLGAFLSERIFTPLGMHHTSFDPPTNGAAVAAPHNSWALTPMGPAIPEGKGWTGGAGAIWSTPTDILAWDLALITGKALSPASYRALTTPRRLTDGRSTGYGCGMSVDDRGPTIRLSHGGAVSGSVTQSTILPASQSAVVLFANSEFALGGITNALVARLLPSANIPDVAGLSAVDAATTYLKQLASGQVDRSTLSDYFNAYLTPERVRLAAASLSRLGPITNVQVVGRGERGGMEVVGLRAMVGKIPVRGSMYRTPDGKIEQLLIYRQ